MSSFFFLLNEFSISTFRFVWYLMNVNNMDKISIIIYVFISEVILCWASGKIRLFRKMRNPTITSTNWITIVHRIQNEIQCLNDIRHRWSIWNSVDEFDVLNCMPVYTVHRLASFDEYCSGLHEKVFNLPLEKLLIYFWIILIMIERDPEYNLYCFWIRESYMYMYYGHSTHQKKRSANPSIMWKKVIINNINSSGHNVHKLQYRIMIKRQ